MRLLAAWLLIGLALSAAALEAAGPRLGAVSVVELTVAGPEDVQALTDLGCDIANVRGNVVTVYALPEELERLSELGYSYTLVPREPDEGKVDTAYHTYVTLSNDLQALADAHPDIARLSSLGGSVQGRTLWAMLITDNPDLEEDEPEFKYVSTIHGDEPLGTELCLYLVERLLDDYGVDNRIANLVDTTEIWIVPLMNPDGLSMNSRYNANGYDLNRSFPQYPNDFEETIYTEPLDTSGRQPEVIRVMQWTAEQSFVLSANFHTGDLVVNYPYDLEQGIRSGNPAPTPDELLFQEISRRYSQYNLPMWNSTEFPDGITNGSDWYAVSGGMQDWNYRYAACNEVTIELSLIKRPSTSLLPSLWADNEESMLSYLEAVHMGVRGLVTDRRTGQPVWAEVRVVSNDHPAYTDPDVGDYHRMLLPGTYTLRIAAPGYVTWTAANIAVANGAATRVDVDLATPDVNGDGLVNAADVQIVVNALLGRAVAYNCDLDGQGIGATDLQIVINTVLGR